MDGHYNLINQLQFKNVLLTMMNKNPVLIHQALINVFNKELKEELNDLRDGSDMFESDMDLNGDKPPDKPK